VGFAKNVVEVRLEKDLKAYLYDLSHVYKAVIVGLGMKTRIEPSPRSILDKCINYLLKVKLPSYLHVL